MWNIIMKYLKCCTLKKVKYAEYLHVKQEEHFLSMFISKQKSKYSIIHKSLFKKK